KQRMIIVDERLAAHFWPNQNPLGHRMYQPEDPKDLLKIDEHTTWLTVIGVVRTVRYQNLEDTGATSGAYYFPMQQHPRDSFTFTLKSSADPASTIRALRSEI